MPACAWVYLLGWPTRAQLLLLDKRDEDVELAQSAQDADQRLEVLYLSIFHALYGGDGNTALVCQLGLRHVLLQAHCFYFGCNSVAKLGVC